MRSRAYSYGLDVLGAEDGFAPGRGVLIQVHNSAQLARSQGAIASVAQALAPETIDAKVLDQIKSELAKALKEKGVDAVVTVVDPASFRPADGSHIWVDVAAGVGGAGVLIVLWELITRMLHGKRMRVD